MRLNRMCYAIPAEVLEINGDDAKVDYGGVKKTINICLLKEVRIGDFVLIHAGFAIEKLDKKSAEESLELMREMLSYAEQDSK